MTGWFSRDKKTVAIDYSYSIDYWVPYEYEDGGKELWELRNGSAKIYWQYFTSQCCDLFDWDPRRFGNSPEAEYSNVRYDIERLSVIPLPGAFWMMSGVALAGVAAAALRARRDGPAPGR